MCGIAGSIRFDAADSPPEILERMVATIKHRGPDDEGFYRSGGVGLGHRRLSIIDLSSAGHQPMTSADGTIWLTYNGEIYNYRELEATLRSRGYAYRSQSDSETIIHAYEEWGTDCVNRFNGMFAFALWDTRRRRLFCARDRFGEKPFYYIRLADRLLFASEIKALLADPSVPAAPNPRVIMRYLKWNVADADTETFFTGISSLPAAHTMVVESARIAIRPYWHPPAPDASDVARSDDDWVEEFRDTLTSAIDLRLRSDVPVGTCLSGGLDSSSIVCLMSRLTQQRVSAFSVVYDDRGFQEGEFIRRVGESVPLDAHSVTPTGQSLYDTLERIVWHNDEPSSSVGQYSQWHAMKLAAEHGVTVILNGQGGDELLGGYHRYFPTYVRELALSGRWRQASRELGGPTTNGRVLERVKQSLYPLVGRPLRSAYRRAVTGRASPSDFVDEDFAAKFDGDVDRAEHHASLADHLVHDLTVASLPALVHHEDRCSMAFSREIRLPFLDPRLVELASRMPASMKIRDGVTKFVLRRAMQDIIPDAVLNRFDKKGYPTPMGKWFRTTAAEETRDLLWSAAFRQRGFVNAGKAMAAFDAHVSGAADHTLTIWQCVNLELWFTRVVEASAKRPVAVPVLA